MNYKSIEMKRLLLIICSLFASYTLMAQDISGSWEGILDAGTKLRVVFNIEQDGEGYSATMDSPDQGVRGIATSECTFDGELLRIKIAKIRGEFSGLLKQDTLIDGTFKQMGYEFPMELTLMTKEIIKANRPQEPVPPYPYISEEVEVINNSAGITLAATLTYPKDGKNLTAAILITGSGAQNRDEELMGHKPFLVLSDHLTRDGIAVLRLDDRSVGGSGGDFNTATSADFVTDIQAAFDYLRGRKEINRAKIGVIGHSEGGTIAFMLAATSKDLAYVVSMAGAAIQVDTVLRRQREMMAEASGASKEAYEANEALVDQMTKIVAENTSEQIEKNMDNFTKQLSPAGLDDNKAMETLLSSSLRDLSSPWMRYIMSYNPSKDLANTKCPVFAINGGKDTQVEAMPNLERISSMTKKGGNERVTTKIYPNLNHLFQNAITGSPTEYGTIEETLDPAVLKDISEWILQTMGKK